MPDSWASGLVYSIYLEQIFERYIFSAHKGRVYMIPAPCGHFTYHWQQRRGTLQARYGEQYVSVPLLVASCMRRRRTQRARQTIETNLATERVRRRLPSSWSLYAWWRARGLVVLETWFLIRRRGKGGFSQRIPP